MSLMCIYAIGIQPRGTTEKETLSQTIVHSLIHKIDITIDV